MHEKNNYVSQEEKGFFTQNRCKPVELELLKKTIELTSPKVITDFREKLENRSSEWCTSSIEKKPYEIWSNFRQTILKEIVTKLKQEQHDTTFLENYYDRFGKLFEEPTEENEKETITAANKLKANVELMEAFKSCIAERYNNPETIYLTKETLEYQELLYFILEKTNMLYIRIKECQSNLAKWKADGHLTGQALWELIQKEHNIPLKNSSKLYKYEENQEAIKQSLRTMDQLAKLNNEDDLINKVSWIQAYWNYIDNHSGNGHHDRFYAVVDGDMQKLLPHSFWAQKDFLKNVSVYTCVHLLIACLFKAPHDFGDVLAFFQSIVLNFCLTESPSIEAFLVWWEKKGRAIKLTTNHHENVIRVMTIHQSKGLAFKVVIIPFCNWGLDHLPQNGPILWSLHHPQSPYFPIRPISYGADLKETHYAKDYYLEQLQIHLDNFNLLYVAFTRAEAQLYVMAPLPEKIEGMATIADLLYQSLVRQKIAGPYGKALPYIADVQETAVGTKFCFR